MRTGRITSREAKEERFAGAYWHFIAGIELKLTGIKGQPGSKSNFHSNPLTIAGETDIVRNVTSNENNNISLMYQFYLFREILLV